MCRLSSNFQTAYAQYVKLVALFVFSVVHVVYMIPFLNTFTAVAFNAEMVDMTPNTVSIHFRHFVDTLVDVSNFCLLKVSRKPIIIKITMFDLMIYEWQYSKHLGRQAVLPKRDTV